MKKLTLSFFHLLTIVNICGMHHHNKKNTPPSLLDNLPLDYEASGGFNSKNAHLGSSYLSCNLKLTYNQHKKKSDFNVDFFPLALLFNENDLTASLLKQRMLGYKSVHGIHYTSSSTLSIWKLINFSYLHKGINNYFMGIHMMSGVSSSLLPKMPIEDIKCLELAIKISRDFKDRLNLYVMKTSKNNRHIYIMGTVFFPFYVDFMKNNFLENIGGFWLHYTSNLIDKIFKTSFTLLMDYISNKKNDALLQITYFVCISLMEILDVRYKLNVADSYTNELAFLLIILKKWKNVENLSFMLETSSKAVNTLSNGFSNFYSFMEKFHVGIKLNYMVLNYNVEILLVLPKMLSNYKGQAPYFSLNPFANNVFLPGSAKNLLVLPNVLCFGLKLKKSHTNKIKNNHTLDTNTLLY